MNRFNITLQDIISDIIQTVIDPLSYFCKKSESGVYISSDHAYELCKDIKITDWISSINYVQSKLKFVTVPSKKINIK